MQAGTVLRFRDGDADAVREMYRSYGGLVYGVAHRILRDPALAEDATPQAFVQAWRAAASFDTTRDPGPGLATIARRVAIDVHRREAIRTYRSFDEPGGDSVVAVQDGVDQAHDVWAVRAAVGELPEDEREVVRLQHLEGMTHTEIAERLGIPVGTVKSRSNRAHRRLVQRLGYLREDG